MSYGALDADTVVEGVLQVVDFKDLKSETHLVSRTALSIRQDDRSRSVVFTGARSTSEAARGNVAGLQSAFQPRHAIRR